MTMPDDSKTMDRLVICTTISKNYLAQARVLMQSVAEHHPEAERVVMLVDEVEDYFDPTAENFTLMLARDLEIPRWLNVSMRYDILELNTAVKPYYLERLFEDYQATKVIYLDPDILLFNPLNAVIRLLDSQMTVLTPHILQPLDDGYRPAELDLLLAGTYNLGFFAISRRGEWRELLRWWQRKLYDQGYSDQHNGMFVDQRWMDFAPSLFDGVYILRDSTYNIAYWNFKHCDLQQGREGYTVNGQPLTFPHFSGFDLYNVEQVSRHQNRHVLSDLQPAFHTLMQDYADRLLAQGYESQRNWPYAYGVFSDGGAITAYHRDCLIEQDPKGDRWENPFDCQSVDNFRDWCITPQGVLSPYMLALYRDRPDLQKLFPHIETGDQLRFAQWFVERQNSSPVFHPHATQPIRTLLDEQGVVSAQIITENKAMLPAKSGRWWGTWGYYRDFPEKVEPYIPANALEVQTEFYTGPGGLYGGVRHLLKKSGILQTLRRLIGLRLIMTARFFFGYRSEDYKPAILYAVDELERGVNVIEYIYSEKGIGQAARNILSALQTTDFPCGFIPIRVDEKDHLHKHPIQSKRGNELYRINLIHLNADATFIIRDGLSEALFYNHYNIAFWFWELEQFPEQWGKYFSAYNEIWAATTFVQQAIAAVSPLPVIHIPLPIAVDVPEG